MILPLRWLHELAEGHLSLRQRVPLLFSQQILIIEMFQKYNITLLYNNKERYIPLSSTGM